MSVPSHFGRYRVLRALAAGEMGVVYLAEDPLIGRKVAIKGIRMDLHTPDAEIRGLQARFEQEIQIAGTFAHPNIVILFDVGHQDGRTFIAMEYIEGRNLRAELQATGPLPVGQVVDIIEPVCHALSYAHERGVIHRDIKPTNILLSEDGVPKITDFGVARLMGSTLTRAGKIFGTPAYMSPEQAISGELTGASDQFAVATLAYELLSGERPFKGTSPAAVIYEVIENHPASLDEIAPLVPNTVAEVVTRGLRKNPKERFDSCADFGVALKEALEWSQANPNLAYLGTPPQLKDKVAISAASLFSGEFFSPAVLKKALTDLGGKATDMWQARRAQALSALQQPAPHVLTGIAGLLVAVVLITATWSALGGNSSMLANTPTTPAATEPVTQPAITSRGSAESSEQAIDTMDNDDPGSATPTFGGAVVEPEEASPTAPDTFSFRVNSRPAGALVMLDGIPVGGATPVPIEVDRTGDHTLRLELDRSQPLTWRFSADRRTEEHFASGVLYFPLIPMVAQSNRATLRPATLGSRTGPWERRSESPATRRRGSEPAVASTPDAPPAANSIVEIHRVKAPTEAPKPTKLHHVEPLLSATPIDGGVVVLEIEISARGNVVQAKVLRGMGPAIDRAALDAIVRWKYEPTTLEGEPVHVVMTVTMRFTGS